MKLLSTITLIFLTLNINAQSLCQKLESQAQDGYLSLGTFSENDQFNYQDDVSRPTFSESLMGSPEVVELIGPFDDERCENALTHDVLIFEGHTLNLVYTIDDSCDGGNSYGYIVDENGKLFASIGDYDIYCIEE